MNKADRMRKRSDSYSSEAKIHEESEEIKFRPRQKSKEALVVSFEGVIESGVFKYDHYLTLLYSVTSGKDWVIVSGEKSGISQMGASDGRYIVWNFPFAIEFYAKSPSGWPYMSLALYGKDFLGRSVIRGYGNIHLPTAEGRHRRTLRTFQPIPISSIATCCAFLHGYINEYVGYEKVLTDPEQQLRYHCRCKSNGQVIINFNVRTHNFGIYGYE